MPIAPTPITPYATPPSSSDPANFDARADAKVADDVVKVGEYNALAVNLFNNATEAVDAATDSVAAKTASEAARDQAALSAQNAATSAGATLWISGQVVTEGETRWSPQDRQVYRRRVTGGGTTDPAADPTNWALVAANGLQLVKRTGTSGAVGANTDTCFTNPAACAATLDLLGYGESAVVRFDNGLLTNTLDLGARGIVGLNGQIRSGVITLDLTPMLSLRWWGDYYRSN